ncbi:hypothetical protein ABZX51_000891 [Aspergillus tubingensis]
MVEANPQFLQYFANVFSTEIQAKVTTADKAIIASVIVEVDAKYSIALWLFNREHISPNVLSTVLPVPAAAPVVLVVSNAPVLAVGPAAAGVDAAGVDAAVCGCGDHGDGGLGSADSGADTAGGDDSGAAESSVAIRPRRV